MLGYTHAHTHTHTPYTNFGTHSHSNFKNRGKPPLKTSDGHFEAAEFDNKLGRKKNNIFMYILL